MASSTLQKDVTNGTTYSWRDTALSIFMPGTSSQEKVQEERPEEREGVKRYVGSVTIQSLLYFCTPDVRTALPARTSYCLV